MAKDLRSWMSGGEATRRSCSAATAAGLGRSRALLLLLLAIGLQPLFLQGQSGWSYGAWDKLSSRHRCYGSPATSRACAIPAIAVRACVRANP
jgi:hypothetical protein